MSSHSTRRQLHRYPNKFFVESGTYIGDGVAEALQCGFQVIKSFEIFPALAQQCQNRFLGVPNVEVILGSSSKLLFEHIKDMDGNITFWLDGHYSNTGTGYDPDNICPLLLELEQIKLHPIKTHTIMIDDRRLLIPSTNGGMDGMFDISEEQVVKKLLEINPNYKIRYEDGCEPNDIIIAYIA